MLYQFDYSKLKGRIKEKKETQDNFAREMKMSYPSLNSRLNNKIGWSNDELVRACEILSIQTEDVPEYFFKKKLKET